jgi:amino acid transporter
LGLAIAAAALITNVSLLNATVLISTRMPSTMAEDGYFPVAFSVRHARYGTPWIAILVSSLISALLAQKTMVQLLGIYVWLRIGVTILTVLASWQLRKRQPDLPRPFRIPWGRTGLLYVIVAPLIMSVVALVGSDPFARKWGPVPVVLGPIVYFVLRKTKMAA